MVRRNLHCVSTRSEGICARAGVGAHFECFLHMGERCGCKSKCVRCPQIEIWQGRSAGQPIETWQEDGRAAFTPAVILFIALPETKDTLAEHQIGWAPTLKDRTSLYPRTGYCSQQSSKGHKVSTDGFCRRGRVFGLRPLGGTQQEGSTEKSWKDPMQSDRAPARKRRGLVGA